MLGDTVANLMQRGWREKQIPAMPESRFNAIVEALGDQASVLVVATALASCGASESFASGIVLLTPSGMEHLDNLLKNKNTIIMKAITS